MYNFNLLELEYGLYDKAKDVFINLDLNDIPTFTGYLVKKMQWKRCH